MKMKQNYDMTVMIKRLKSRNYDSFSTKSCRNCNQNHLIYIENMSVNWQRQNQEIKKVEIMIKNVKLWHKKLKLRYAEIVTKS